jgi:molybdopterin-synthase adenylyltransferase
MTITDQERERYSRQMILEQIGEEGQERLLEGFIVIIGVGALGTTIANTLVRSGVGRILIVDRDLVELSNLQRQLLFTEEDVGKPKATAAADRLRMINSSTEVEAIVDDVHYANVEEIIKGADIVIDGTDNMETRFLLNDACVKHGIPWIYGGAVGSYGMTMNILPGTTPCLKCIISNLPDAGALATCDTVGVLTAIPTIIGSIQATEAMKILIRGGEKEIDEATPMNQDLLVWDIWRHSYQNMEVKRHPGCSCCVKKEFDFLNAGRREIITSLCGTNSVQITPVEKGRFRFQDLVERMDRVEGAETNEICVKIRTNGFELVIFRTGRLIVHGTKDKNIAKSLYAKYVGV